MKPKEQLQKIWAMNYFQVWRKENRQPENYFINILSIEKHFCEISVPSSFLWKNTDTVYVRSEKERLKIMFRLFLK